MSRYAVVPTSGCYGSGQTVRALSTHASLSAAMARAKSATRSYRSGMARHGGSSGGYRVVTTAAESAREATWLGHELDRTPDAWTAT